MRLYLQSVLDSIPLSALPESWQTIKLSRFSQDKSLFDFQVAGLHNTIKALWLFYKELDGSKSRLFSLYRANGLEADLDYNLTSRMEGKTAKLLLEYDESYPVLNNKISFEHFINRMSSWMATGSGKTLLIVKLIEILGILGKAKAIPEKDILFLAHREDLLDQFRNHIEEFNSFSTDLEIRLKSLRDYESVKRERPIPTGKTEVIVFYYRSDLVSDVHKEKLVDYHNYDNEGNWYILLDEAHKGDKEDSKRQVIYSILSRNGFLFNYSATFTDPRDYVTCAFNFNLSRFTEEGYGKHIYISKSEISAFRDRSDFSAQEKQKIVLKSLLLFTYVSKYYEKIIKIDSKLYHHPLLLTLVNSVDVRDADLKLFFDELEHIAESEISRALLNEAKAELSKEFETSPTYEFEDLACAPNSDLILKLEYKDILKCVFNAHAPGNFEVLKVPGNRSELVFKLRTCDKPFMLIKIGDVSGWLKDKLDGYEINESYENESYFQQLNRHESSINVLMGSRAFYEGWDSNRPNLILFVNIGVGGDAKKFVLQSVGRGVRIEPFKNKRRRLIFLNNLGVLKGEIFQKIYRFVEPVESLFVFGTNAENLREIIGTLKEERQEISLESEFSLNKEVEKHLLLVPTYRYSEKIFAEEKVLQKYPISREDVRLVKKYYDYLGEKVCLVKYLCETRLIKKTQESLKDVDKYFDLNEQRTLREPALLLGRILDYFGVRSKELDDFNKLSDEIVHYKKIRFSDGDRFEEILKRIRQVKNYDQKELKIRELRSAFKKHKDIEKYDRAKEKIDKEYQQETTFEKIRIKYIENHYYIPLVMSESDKIDYLNHIIKVPSEVEFLHQLEEYIASPGNMFSELDWWMFSKIDETLDEIHIPYYDPKENTIAKFKPDFVFWLQKGKKYFIIFVDPKGTEHTDGLRKIDGYVRIFETPDKKESRVFKLDGLDLSTRLLLKPRRGVAEVPDNYKKYWFDNFGDFSKSIM